MYYFIGIKGTGMSALAVILKQLGYEVSGSDLDKHFFTESELIKNNIPFFSYDEKNILDDYIIIKGASIREDNVELKRARSLNLKIYEYNEMVGELTKRYKTICIAGCHGKTTTTNMMALAFSSKGINYLIGDGTGCGDSKNTYFALESCEYQRHFLAYHPRIAVILNIDLDHVDYYRDIDDVIDAYTSYANLANDVAVLYGDDPYTRKMKLKVPAIYFGLAEGNDVRAINVSYSKDGVSFDIEGYGHFDLPLFGQHQLLDALAVITVSMHEGLSYDEVFHNLKQFHGAKRRFSESFVGNNVIIDDYAHHPNEVKATIDAVLQKYPDKKLIIIFQPHTFSRTKEFYRDLANVFKRAYASYVLPIHPAREKQEDYEGVTSRLITDIVDHSYLITVNDAKILASYDNAVFTFMSPNDISGLENDLKKYLMEKEGEVHDEVCRK